MGIMLWDLPNLPESEKPVRVGRKNSSAMKAFKKFPYDRFLLRKKRRRSIRIRSGRLWVDRVGSVVI